jgi:cytochrome P460
MKTFLFVIGILILLISIGTFIISKENGQKMTFSPYVDEKGGISLPKDFRDNWTHLGAWASPDNTAKGFFHDVFTQPGIVEGFKKNNNRFPDGAVLVKEVRSVKSASMTTGPNVLSADKEVLWFVMIKNDKNRFPNNPNWGDGWGWALFNAKDPSKNVSTDFKKDCIPCHVPARQTDWVYIQGYPSLHE